MALDDTNARSDSEVHNQQEVRPLGRTPSLENSPDIPETIDPQAVIQAFCGNEAEAKRLGKHGRNLWKLLARYKNPTTQMWVGHTLTDIRGKHHYREAILRITEEHGQTDIVDACVLEDLEALRTDVSGGVVRFPYPYTGIISGTEFAVSCGLETARLVGNPNGRIRKKIDEISLEEIVFGFWFHVSINTPWQMRVRTGLNILILAFERQGREPAKTIEAAKYFFVERALPLLNDPEYFLMIPNDVLENIIPYLKKYDQAFYNLYGIIMAELQPANPEITAKLERCPRFKEMIDARTAELQALREKEETDRNAQRAATAERRADEERQIEAAMISELEEFDRAISEFHPSEEVFALDVLRRICTYGSDVRKYASFMNNKGQTISISHFDDWWNARCYGAGYYSDNTRLRYETLLIKWEVVKNLWQKEVPGFTANPTRAIYQKIIDREFPGLRLEGTLRHLNDAIEGLISSKIFPENCVVFQLLLEKRQSLERNIEKSHMEEATTEAAREYQRALSEYQTTIQSVDTERQEAIDEQGAYPEELEKTHIEKLVTAKSDYLKELYRIGAGMDIDAWSDVDTEDEENLAYVELAGNHSGSKEISVVRGGGGYSGGGMRLVQRLVQQQIIIVTLTQSDRIVTVTGKEIDRQRSRLQMVDWTTAHEVGHIIDVLHREGGEDDHNRYSNTIITRHLDELASAVKTVNPAERKLFQTELRKSMEECMMDGIAYRLLQNYGTSDFEYDRHEHRLEQAAHAFIAACTNARHNMGVYLDVRMEKERGFKYCLILLRLIVNAKIHSANISEFSDGTLEDISLDIQNEIMELETLYYQILIHIADESGEFLIDIETETNIEELFDAMFNEGLNLEFENALNDNFKRHVAIAECPNQ